MAGESNGNGYPRHRDVWGAASVCSAIALAIGAAFGSSYVREQDRDSLDVERVSQRVSLLEGRGYIDAAAAGRLEQEIRELRGIAAVNTARHDENDDKLDTMLQREIRLVVEPERVRIAEIERRLGKVEDRP